jgi:hypothetical protein
MRWERNGLATLAIDEASEARLLEEESCYPACYLCDFLFDLPCLVADGHMILGILKKL